MRGIYENKKIYMSSDVLNLQGKLFGVGKKIAIFYLISLFISAVGYYLL